MAPGTWVNQIKVPGAGRGSRLKANVIADPNETAGVPIRRQEPSARTSFQEWFGRSKVGKAQEK